MTLGHSHDAAAPIPIARWTRITVLVLIALSALASLLGVLHWWPDGDRLDRVRGVVPVTAKGVEVVHAELLRVRTACTGTLTDPVACGSSQAKVLDGAQAGTTVDIDLTPDVIGTGLRVGDHVLLLDTSQVAPGSSAFAFYRSDRASPMLWLAVLFAVLVVLVAWRRGLMALVSLGFAGVVIVGFLLPALLSGKPAVPTTVAASVLVLVVMLYATHGFSMRTSVALLGALIGVGLSTAAAWFAVIGTRVGGLGDESASLLTFNVGWIDVQQLVIASVVVAGLGTLNDVTITQVSALWELRAASPDMPRRRLFTSAMRIGRDHVASTVYTLVFAYLGTALVLLVAVQLYGGRPIDFVTAEDVAEEIVRALVGGIALVLAMPITTVIGALVATTAAPPPPPTPAPAARRPGPPPTTDPYRYRHLPSDPWQQD